MHTNDITIASFPKAGVSYLGFLLTAARAHHNKLSIRPTFFNIDWLLVDSDKMGNKERPRLWNDGMGDFVKTHQISDDRTLNVVYLLRNPFDTLKSFYHFRKQLGIEKVTAREFLDGPHGINAWVKHLNSWIISSRSASQSVYVVQYEDLVRDPAGQLGELMTGLGFYYADKAIEEAVACTRLSYMRQLEREFADRNPAYQQFNLQFVRPGDKREVSEFDAARPYIESKTTMIYAAVKSKLPLVS